MVFRISFAINKYNTILMNKKTLQTSQHLKQEEVSIIGWEEGILMPRNMNVSQFNPTSIKTLAHNNRKQFIQRRRKNENQKYFQNLEPFDEDNSQKMLKMQKQKQYSTLNNGNFSSINQLRRQMENIQKIKDRWQEIFESSQNNDNYKNIVKISQSGFIKSHQDRFDAENQDFRITNTFLRQIHSCRSNRQRPQSSLRTDERQSITLSQRNKERSKTIHSRGSNRILSCKQRNLKLKSKSNKLNITINQIQGKKMESILKILWNHS